MLPTYPETLAEARKQGARYYAPSLPCMRGHISLRLTSKRICCECNKETARNWRQANPTRVKNAAQKWRQRNLERDKESKKEWKANAKQDGRFYSLKGRARKATPAWADRATIARIYCEARELTKRTGIQYHVDHIIPLCGHSVCGLHVHNNLQILSASANMQKHRTWTDDAA